MLSLSKLALDSFLGRDLGLASTDQVVAALKKSKHLALLNDTELKSILQVGGSLLGTAAGMCLNDS
jgi:hypothetical protein